MTTCEVGPVVHSTNLLVNPKSKLGLIGSPDCNLGPLVIAVGSRGPWFDHISRDSTFFLDLFAKGHFDLFLVLRQDVWLRLVWMVVAEMLLLFSCSAQLPGSFRQFGSPFLLLVLVAVVVVQAWELVRLAATPESAVPAHPLVVEPFV